MTLILSFSGLCLLKSSKYLIKNSLQTLYVGNHEVVMRGTFGNVRIRNRITDMEGGYSTYFPTNEIMTVFDAAMKYAEDQAPLDVIAGKEYGSGSSRDWATKGTNLLGQKILSAYTSVI